MKRLIRTVAVLGVLAWAGPAGAGAALLHDADASDAKDQTKSGMKGAGAEGAKSEATKPGDDKPFDEVVKDMEVVKGLFTFYHRAEDGKILMEIAPDQLDKRYLFAATLDQAVGERGFYGAQQLGDFPLEFHQVGKSIQLIELNTEFSAPPGSPAARAIARSFPNAILGAAKLQSKPIPSARACSSTPPSCSSRTCPGSRAAFRRPTSPAPTPSTRRRARCATSRTSPRTCCSRWRCSTAPTTRASSRSRCPTRAASRWS